jgi:hypothetical protein
MKHTGIRAISGLVMMVALAGVARATTIDLDTTVHGALDNFGSNNGADGSGAGNVLAGQQGSYRGNPAVFYHNYFVFDLSGITGKVTAATFHITDGGYLTFPSEPSETLGLFDVDSSNISALVNQNTNSDTTAYNDLGGGQQYGSGVFTSANLNQDVTITLDAAALANLNAAIGEQFAIGGAVTTLGTDPSSTAELFAYSGANSTHPYLELTLASVPLPTSIYSAAILLLGLEIHRRARPARAD